QLQKDIHKTFNLTKEYPIRVGVYELKDTKKTVLLVLIHHIAFDAWSGDILFKELQKLYQGEVLKPLEIQYVDYANWQKTLDLDKGLHYWKNYLDGYEALNIATDYPRPKELQYQGDSIDFEIDEILTQRIEQYAKTHGVTVYSLLLSMVSLLLAHYSGQDDIMIGSPVANRNHPGTANLIGFFVNTLPLRIQLQTHQLFSEFVKKVHENELACQNHQDIPLEKIIDIADVERDTSRHPLFQVLFNLIHNKHQKQWLKPMDSDYSVSKFDIDFNFAIQEKTIAASIAYSTSLFEKQSITRMLESLQHLMTQVLEVDNPIKSYQAITPHDYQKVIIDWNQTGRNFPQKTLHQLFIEQVAKTPNAIALVFEGKSLSYKELDEKSNQLANFILKQNLSPLIALCLERSLEMVISILAVLKAGCAYVPMDPGAPQSRIKHMLDD
ncbi:MAG: condensation domain-containing protein, partial [Actinomycetes bacterium]